MSDNSVDSDSDLIPEGHVRLILLSNDNSFYLQIPIDTINNCCLKPRKYLLFLGWCILGVEGLLSRQQNGRRIYPSGSLEDQGTYYYVADVGDLSTAVDPEVIKERTTVLTETEESRADFRTRLLDRDVGCVWTGIRPRFGGVGMHIIPFKRGSDWLRLIVDKRPRYGEDVTDININDIRNGVFAYNGIHTVFDQRYAAVLKTPNHVLTTDDIPPCQPRTLLPNTEYPSENRYTLQWLEPEGEDKAVHKVIRHNSDAAFKTHAEERPSDLLLHYNYGAAAIKMWGEGKDVLQQRAKFPRSPRPAKARLGPSRGVHDRKVAIGKRGTGRNVRRGPDENATAGPSRITRSQKRDTDGVGSRNPTAGAAIEGIEDSEGQARWDEDDVMLFFWGNSKASKERDRKKLEETTQHMEQWREGVAQTSV